MISNKGVIINDNWVYSHEGKSKCVQLPHTCKEVSYNYFDEKSYQFISDYERNLFVNQNVKRVFLKFEGVMTAFELFVNDCKVKECRGGYIPHTIELTDFVNKGMDNKVLVKVDSTERMDIPPFGHVIDYLTFSGIYRDVVYYEVEHCFMENIFYKYTIEKLSNGARKVVLTPEVVIDNKLEAGCYNIEVKLDGKIFNQTVEVVSGKETYSLDPISLEEIKLWGIDDPNLYEVTTTLSKETILDTNTMKIGFRKLHIDETGIYLNDEKIKIFGLNRHQSFPYVGYAMPKRVQEKDADILKEELGLNCVRTSHYPQSPYFLNRCDEIGLLVLEEIPGWQNISQDERWRKQVLADVEGMIKRDFNHPSIITWGVRINESWDDEALYTATNNLARTLDDTRLTSGVRNLEKSQFLEDIYTMNDFIHNGGEKILRDQEIVTGLDHKVPYLVTEFCGHIYPTKRFDNEERLVEHALRHGRVHSNVRTSDDYLGAVGWCAFDYNTHYDFGSGDRICYHGVMDMNRMPKFAAYLYRSQKSPKDEIVIEPLTYWTMGEKCAASVFPVEVCTNCEAIEVIINGVSKGIYKREDGAMSENLKGLAYPPIHISALNEGWGSKWSDVIFRGFINGKIVGEKAFCANPTLEDLEVSIDDTSLSNSEFDATRVCIKAVDRCGNLLPYIQGALTVEVEGPIEVIGNTLLPLTGGCMAFWIKTKANHIKGMAKIKIQSSFDISKETEIILD